MMSSLELYQDNMRDLCQECVAAFDEVCLEYE